MQLKRHKEKELLDCQDQFKKGSDKTTKEELKRHILLLERQCTLDKQELTRIEEGNLQ